MMNIYALFLSDSLHLPILRKQKDLSEHNARGYGEDGDTDMGPKCVSNYARPENVILSISFKPRARGGLASPRVGLRGRSWPGVDFPGCQVKNAPFALSNAFWLICQDDQPRPSFPIR